MEPATYNSIGIVILTAALAFAANAFWNARKNRQNRAEALEAEGKSKAEALKLEESNKAAALKLTADTMSSRVRDLENQLATLTATFTPISAAFQAVLIKQLTHFHTPEMDALLVKAGEGTLSVEEHKDLKVMLIARAKDLNGRIDDSERDAALMLPMVMSRVRQGASVSESEVMVVLVPKEFNK